MWRYFVGAGAALLLAVAGMFLFRSSASQEVGYAPPAPVQRLAGTATAAEPLPDRAPEATPRSREERRFDRYDKDRDAAITRAEYLASRRKAYARLDTNGDGRLDFDEWAVRTTGKFATADQDRSGALDRAEFATTAVKRKAAPRRAPCPPVKAAGEDEEG